MNNGGGILKKNFTVLSLLIICCLVLSNISTIPADSEKPFFFDPTEEIPPVSERSLDDLCNLVEPNDWWKNASFDPCQPQRNLPSSFDWRDFGGDPPIRDQGSCGGCWAFATTGALECNIKIIHNRTIDLSEQWLINCNNNGWNCDGGWFAHSYHIWKTDPCGYTGAVLEEYVPYTALNDPCNCPYPHDYYINNWSYIGNDNSIPPVSSIKQAILDHGPVSVAIRTNPAFQQYTGGVFNSHSALAVNHAVVLVGWNDSQGTNGVWILRNSWGSAWGENGHMRIEYGCSSVGYAACYVNYTPSLLEFKLPNGVPEIFTPGISANFTIEIKEINDTLINSTPALHYRYDSGSYQTIQLNILGNNFYKAMLPPANCGDSPEYYISAQGATSGIHTYPYDAPNITFSSFVGVLSQSYFDDFENDTGWTVSNDNNLIDGEWERGIPIGGGDRGDPPTDFDGSGNCFLTNNVDGNSDVDGGITYLISPKLNLSDGYIAVINYAIWYTNYFGINPHADYFDVYLSNDDGVNYQLVQSIGPYSVAAWIPYRLVVNEYMTPTDSMRLLFVASDLGLGSIVEAGVDSCSAYTLTCSNYIPISNLTPEWNMISGPFNQSLSKNSIIVEHNNTYYSWNEAVQNNIIINLIFSWNRTSQNSEIISELIPGFSYWSYAFESCSYYCYYIKNNSYNSHITTIEEYWNLLSTPYDFEVNKTNLSIHHNGQWYTWDAAVNASLILPFIYSWSNDLQGYYITDIFPPGEGVWIYAYESCSIYNLQV